MLILEDGGNVYELHNLPGIVYISVPFGDLPTYRVEFLGPPILAGTVFSNGDVRCISTALSAEAHSPHELVENVLKLDKASNGYLTTSGQLIIKEKAE